MKKTGSAEQRALLIVNSLSKQGNRKFRRLYRFIESAGVLIAKKFLAPHYRQIVVLKDRSATYQAFLETIGQLSNDRRIRAVDLFLQLHGKPGSVYFYDRQVMTRRLSLAIRKAALKDCLRIVYNTSCYGDSHSGDLLSAGFKAAVGSIGVNANAASEYPVFCRYWPGTGRNRRNKPGLAELIKKADRQGPRLFADRLAGRYFKDVDSRKNVRGDGTITVDKF